jgi:ketosteroid isomerase-like protein
MIKADNQVMARRRLTNRLIAAKQADRLAPFFDPGAVLIAGDGATIIGRPAIIQAFAAQFADPAFIAYERIADRVCLDAAGLRAAEHGQWTGRWAGGVTMSGDYLAVWRKVFGQWVIERELYVTLS